MLGDVETYQQGGVWHSRIQGQAEPFASGGTRAEQVERGRQRAITDGVDHIIDNVDGTIDERVSFGHDSPDIPR